MNPFLIDATTLSRRATLSGAVAASNPPVLSNFIVLQKAKRPRANLSNFVHSEKVQNFCCLHPWSES